MGRQKFEIVDVYQGNELMSLQNSVTQITRKHPFRVVTTRVLHPGLHQVSLIMNGTEFEKHDFELVE